MKAFIIFCLIFLKPSTILAYSPTSETLINNTLSISGNTSSLTSDDTDYRVLKSYISGYNADYQSTAVDVGSSFTGSTTYQDKAVLTWTVPTPDQYLVIATADVSKNSTNAARTTKTQLTVDGITAAESMTVDDTVANLYRPFSAITVDNLAAGSHTLKIQYGTTNNNNLASIKNARLTAFRLGGFAQGTEPIDSTTTSTAYTTIGSISITPDTTEDWIIFSHAEVTNSNTSNLDYVSLNIGNTVLSESVTRTYLTSGYLPATAIKTQTLTANTSYTFSIQMKTNGGTMTYRNAHLYAIPKSQFPDLQQVTQNTESTCTTCTSASPTDKATLTFTPPSTADYLLIGNGEVETDSATVNVGVRMLQGAVNLGEANIDVGNTAHYTTFTFSKLLSLPASAQTFKIQFYTQTSGTQVRIRNTNILAIKMPPASSQTIEAEYSGIGDTNNWTSLVWDGVMAWDHSGVGVTLQLYNYNSSSYPVSGDGFYSYISNSVAQTEENPTQTISLNPNYFRSSQGTWKLKVTATTPTTERLKAYLDKFTLAPTSIYYSVSISDGIITYGNMGWGTTKSTLSTDLNDSQIVTNTSNTLANINILGVNTSCPWTLSNLPNIDTYALKFSTNEGVGWTNLSTSYQTVTSSVGIGNTLKLDFKIYTPTSTSCTNSQSPNVIIQAVAP